MRKWRTANPEKSNAINVKSRKKNWHKWRAKALATRRALYRKTYLVRQYGITQEDYNRMLAAQNYRCAICETDNPESRHSDGFPWHVDHDHATGRVRGLLCFSCNSGLGHFKDNLVRVENAAKYLKGV